MSKGMNANTGRPAGKPWTAEDDARLKGLGNRPRELMSWAEVATHMDGRSAFACRQRYSTLRARAAGRAVPPPRGSERKANGRLYRNPAGMASMQAPPDPERLPRPSSLTAAVFGDPPPGRSALDQMKGSLA